ncbi:spirocyclase AveC family protein [Streptomyces sp. NPDC002577]
MQLKTAPTENATAARTRLRPGWALAAFGALFIGVQAWTYAHWFARGAAGVSYERPPSMPDLTAVTVRLSEGVVLLGVLWLAYLAVREWRRLGRPGFDSVLLLAWTLTMWVDVLSQRAARWNPYLLHMETWITDIPGLSGVKPIGGFTTLVTPAGLSYPVMMVPVVLTCVLTRKLMERRPAWGALRRFTVAAVIGTLLQGIVEISLVMAGTYSTPSYSSLVQSFSLWGGHWYQLAPPDTLVLGVVITAPLAVMRLNWQAGGTPFIYRGLENVPGRWGAWARPLAAVGWVNLTLLFWMGVAYLMTIDAVAVSDLPDYFAGRYP